MKIEIEDLFFTYPGGVEALSGVSLEIQPGELVAIVGQNGAGKTTLMRHLNGLLQPARGAVRVGDWDTRQHTVAQLASRVGYVFQNPDEQLFCRSVKDEVRFGPQNLKYSPERIAELVHQSMELTGLTGKEDTNPYDLSPTWRKMVALASILAMDSPVVILDEPTTGQDAASILRIAEIVAELKRGGKSVLTITHDIDFCAENFQRLIVMGKGRVLLDGPMHQILAQDEVMRSTYVDPPQLTRLGRGLGLPGIVCNQEELLGLLRRPAKQA
jgi:energy-coupling factor transport system ATP-binding protein